MGCSRRWLILLFTLCSVSALFDIFYTVAAGAVFTHWGRAVCPKQSSVLDSGFVGGSHYYVAGGSSGYLCLSSAPEFHSEQQSIGIFMTQVASTEYDHIYTPRDLHNQNVPCAVCLADRRAALVTLTGRLTCPDIEWTVEYTGFLMTAPEGSEDRKRSSYLCVSDRMEAIPGMDGDSHGALLSKTYIDCSGWGDTGMCPPYFTNKTLACVVCTK